jgi:STE24 endopeptidase
VEAFSPQWLEEIKAYQAPHYLWAAVGDAVNLAVFAALLRWGVRPLYRWASAHAEKLPRSSLLEKLWGGPGWSAALLFALYDYLLAGLLYFPLELYFNWFHERAFGLSRYTPGAYAWDTFKGKALMVFATAALAFGLFGLARRLKRWWLVLGVPVAALLWLSASIDPYRNRLYFEQHALEAGPLRTRITELLLRAEVDFAEVLVERSSRTTPRVGAYFAGEGPTRSIVLADSTLERFTPAEVLAAVAHEAGHVHETRWPGKIASAAAMIAFLYAIHRLFALAARRRWWGIDGYADIRALPLITLVFYLATNLVQPVSGYFSRQREAAADQYAVRLTGDSGAFRSMLIKAARINKMDPYPPRWVVWMGWRHPPIGERLQALSDPTD